MGSESILKLLAAAHVPRQIPGLPPSPCIRTPRCRRLDWITRAVSIQNKRQGVIVIKIVASFVTFLFFFSDIFTQTNENFNHYL